MGGYTEFEQIRHNAYCAAERAQKNGGGCPEDEEIISQNIEASMLYARNTLKGRFELGEAIIATNAVWSYFYAHDVLKDKFPKGEAIMRNTPWWDDYQAMFK